MAKFLPAASSTIAEAGLAAMPKAVKAEAV
jgi:hypothetical protein